MAAAALLALSACAIGAEGFVIPSSPIPSSHRASSPRSLLSSSSCFHEIAMAPRLKARSLGNALGVGMSAGAGASIVTSQQAAPAKLGPHIKIGKKGAILNPWGLWVLTYSMVLAFTGYLYLKIRQAFSFLIFGRLKPTAEHCCWIMHSWCKIVLSIGLSAPEVKGLENLPPRDETILVAANHMSWFDVPVLHGFLAGRLLWSFAKAELVNVPVLGTYMQTAEHILISRQSRKSQLESLKSAIKTLSLKRNVFIFPEGTRSLDGETACSCCSCARAEMPTREAAGVQGRSVHYRAQEWREDCSCDSDRQRPCVSCKCSDASLPRPGDHENGARGRGAAGWVLTCSQVVHPAIDPEGKTDEELMEETRVAIASALPAEKVSS
eukprot:541713-Hanusia_phi.AAC.4